MILIVLSLLGSWAVAADLALDPESRRLIEEAQPARAQVQPAKPRRLLIFTRNVGYGGHLSSRAHANEAFTLMGKKTGAFETTISEDPTVFQRESLQQFDAVFLNNTIGNTLTDPQLRQNLLEYVTGGGGLLGVHGTSIAFMDWQWPPVEDWPEFGNMIGARGAYHRDDKEHVWIKIDEPDHPMSRAFGGQGFERRDEFFRFHDPYSRQLNRVLLSMDVAKTDLTGIQPDEHLLREDNDYAVAWIRNYGRGRVFYCSLAHSDSVFRDPKMLQFYLDAAQFVLGDLDVPTTPSARLSPAVLAQEKLGWRLGIEAYTFHKFTFFETIEKTAELGLPYIGGLSFMQQVSKDMPKSFDQHLSDDELRQIRLKMDSAGVRLLTYYAQDIPGDEAGCRKLFEFGRKMGIETFMCEPKPESLEMLDAFCNEYGINVAIHNHGQNISPLYWRPEGVLKACEGRSKRIGAAPDLGYWLRSGIDPIEGVRLLKDRLITVQMHDLHEPGGNGHDVPWGTGTGKSEEFLRELHRQGIRPTMIGLEYSHDWFESMPQVAKCIEFFNATTLTLAAETTNPPIPATAAETVQDADGNIYHTVKIGNQVWTVENLRTTKFNDGTPIPNVTDAAGWQSLTTPGFCYYENNPEHGKKYGALYNWYAASSDKIAPKGWRVPTHEEQMALRDYLIANGYNYDETTEGNKVAKSMAATTDWIYKPANEGNDPVPDIGTVGKNPETNNRSGFSALPAGSRWNDGSFHAIGTSVYWWSITPDSAPIKAHMSSVHTWFAKYGVVIQHGTQSRSDAKNAGLHDLIRSGKFGKLKISYGYCCKPRGSIGVKSPSAPPAHLDWNLWRGPARIEDYHDNFVHYNWHWFWKTGNGDLNNQGTHPLDMAYWALDKGLTNPIRAMAIGGRFLWNDQGETPNTMLGIAEYPNGQYVFFNVRNVNYDGYQRQVENEYYFEDGGRIVGGQYYPKGSDQGEKIDVPDGHVTPGGQFGSFIAACRAGDPQMANGNAVDAHHSCVLGHLMNNSYRLGQGVPFNAKAGRFGDNQDACEHFMKLHEIMSKDVGIPEDGNQYIVGPWLTFDPETERCTGAFATEANELLKDANRPGFQVPDAMDV